MEKAASFLVGMVAGAAVIVAAKGHDLDLLYLKVRNLTAEIVQLREENLALKEDLADRQRQSIRRVKRVEVEAEAPDEFTKLEIIKFVKELTRPLLNKELTYLETHPRLVTGLIEGRILTSGAASYMLRVESVFIGETLHLWVKGIKQDTNY